MNRVDRTSLQFPLWLGYALVWVGKHSTWLIKPAMRLLVFVDRHWPGGNG